MWVGIAGGGVALKKIEALPRTEVVLAPTLLFQGCSGNRLNSEDFSHENKISNWKGEPGKRPLPSHFHPESTWPGRHWHGTDGGEWSGEWSGSATSALYIFLYSPINRLFCLFTGLMSRVLNAKAPCKVGQVKSGQAGPYPVTHSSHIHLIPGGRRFLSLKVVEEMTKDTHNRFNYTKIAKKKLLRNRLNVFNKSDKDLKS